MIRLIARLINWLDARSVYEDHDPLLSPGNVGPHWHER